MSFFDSLIVNSVFIVFPLLVSMIYATYKKNNNQELDDTIFQITLFTSLYLIMRYGLINKSNYNSLLVDVPLIFAFSQKKKTTPVLISLLLIFYRIYILKYNTLFTIIEYTLYFLIYIYFRKKEKKLKFYTDVIITLKSFFFAFITCYFLKPNIPIIENIIYILLNVFIFYFTMKLYIYLLGKGHQVLSLDMTIKDLKKEKQIQKSLFKITHEIKNPIAVCKGYLDMIDLNDINKSKKYIPIVKEEINRTLTLMDDFLDYSRISINKEILDINMLLEDTLSVMQPLFKGKNININFNVIDKEIYIEGDYNRLKQVLINILKNCLEAKKEDSKLKININLSINGNNINLSIDDNGKGIDKESLKKIGEAFYTTKENGTGLGVCLSKEIIKKHNGTIIYESTKERGTTVKITLPKYEIC